jgi:hypothetical protein
MESADLLLLLTLYLKKETHHPNIIWGVYLHSHHICMKSSNLYSILSILENRRMIMNKLSVKLGSLFFVILFGLITFMFFFLHTEIAETRIQQELQNLQSRGNSHKAILEKQFDQELIDHVVLMESESNTDVVIINGSGTLLDSSAPVQQFKKYIMAPLTPIPGQGQVVEEN